MHLRRFRRNELIVLKYLVGNRKEDTNALIIAPRSGVSEVSKKSNSAQYNDQLLSEAHAAL